MYRTMRVAFVVLILAIPFSQAAASTSGGRAEQARSSSDDLAPGIPRGATRCVAVEDVYTYEVGDRDMPLALKSLEHPAQADDVVGWRRRAAAVVIVNTHLPERE